VLSVCFSQNQTFNLSIWATRTSYLSADLTGILFGLIIHDGSAFYTGKVGPLVDEAFLGGRVVADDLLNAVF